MAKSIEPIPILRGNDATRFRLHMELNNLRAEFYERCKKIEALIDLV